MSYIPVAWGGNPAEWVRKVAMAINGLEPSVGTGTVTSVGMTVPTGFSVSGSPVTTSGSFTLTYSAGFQGYTSAEATKLAGIASGATANTGTVTSVNASGGTTGLSFSGGAITTSGTLTLGGTLAVANGGTGVTSSTGSGSVVLSTSPTLTGTALAAQIDASGRVSSASCVRVTGLVTVPAGSGSGLEMYYNGTAGQILAFDRTGVLYLPLRLIGSTLALEIGAAVALSIDANRNVYPTTGTTAMTSGFFYIPAAAGAPSGTPTAITGRVPMYYDTTNNNFYIYNGAWKKVLLT